MGWSKVLWSIQSCCSRLEFDTEPCDLKRKVRHEALREPPAGNIAHRWHRPRAGSDNLVQVEHGHFPDLARESPSRLK